MYQGGERPPVQLKKYHVATYQPQNSRNANKAYAEYQKRFGGASTAQPSEDILPKGGKRAGSADGSAWKKTESDYAGIQQYQNLKTEPKELEIVDHYELHPDQKASNQ